MNDFLNSNVAAKQFLNEKLFDIKRKDIDIIANSYESFINTFYDFKTKIVNLRVLRTYKLKTEYIFDTISSHQLINSSEIKKANETNPVDIHIGIHAHNHYDPKLQRIFIAFNQDLYEYLMDSFREDSITIEEIKDSLIDSQAKNVEKEFSINDRKSSIVHELSHWLNDTLHNSNIEKGLRQRMDIWNKTGDIKKANKKSFGDTDINTTYMEIDAQIHAIKDLKRRYNRIWNSMTIFDMLSKLLSLKVNYRDLAKQGKEKQWLQRIIKRLHRENLLGKNMNFIPNDDREMF